MLFQSSLGPKTERYQVIDDFTHRSIDVSILARPEDRALHLGHDFCHARQEVSILARPEDRALPLSVCVSRCHSIEFQSSLGPKTERYALTEPYRFDC